MLMLGIWCSMLYALYDLITSIFPVSVLFDCHYLSQSIFRSRPIPSKFDHRSFYTVSFKNAYVKNLLYRTCIHVGKGGFCLSIFYCLQEKY